MRETAGKKDIINTLSFFMIIWILEPIHLSTSSRGSRVPGVIVVAAAADIFTTFFWK